MNEALFGEGELPLFLVTVKLPKDPARPHPLSCRHVRKNDRLIYNWAGHCGEMECANYLDKCPQHAISGDASAACNRIKTVGDCPMSPNETCSDATGEHHTIAIRASDAAVVEEVARERGWHVTRVERPWLITVS